MEHAFTQHGDEHQTAVTTDADKSLYQADNFDPQASLGNLLRLAFSSLQAQIDRHMGPQGLTAMQWQPLTIIASGQAQTAADLSRLMQVDTGATTRMLDRLAAKGLVARERNMTDRRLIKLTLTESGARAAAAIPGALCEALNTHLDGFDQQDLSALTGLLSRLIENGKKLSDKSA